MENRATGPANLIVLLLDTPEDADLLLHLLEEAADSLDERCRVAEARTAGQFIELIKGKLVDTNPAYKAFLEQRLVEDMQHMARRRTSW